MGRLLQAAALLGHGSGLSCGVASRAELNRLELEPADQVRALLRLADAEQYRQKLAGSDTTLPTRARMPGSRRTAADFRELADAVNSLTQGILAEPGEVGQRLSRVAATVCETSNGAAYWVSEIDGERILDRYCGTPRDEETRDGQWQPTTLDPRATCSATSPRPRGDRGRSSSPTPCTAMTQSVGSWSRPASGSGSRPAASTVRHAVAGRGVRRLPDPGAAPRTGAADGPCLVRPARRLTADEPGEPGDLVAAALLRQRQRRSARSMSTWATLAVPGRPPHRAGVVGDRGTDPLQDVGRHRRRAPGQGHHEDVAVEAGEQVAVCAPPCGRGWRRRRAAADAARRSLLRTWPRG